MRYLQFIFSFIVIALNPSLYAENIYIVKGKKTTLYEKPSQESKIVTESDQNAYVILHFKENKKWFLVQTQYYKKGFINAEELIQLKEIEKDYFNKIQNKNKYLNNCTKENINNFLKCAKFIEKNQEKIYSKYFKREDDKYNKLILFIENNKKEFIYSDFDINSSKSRFYHFWDYIKEFNSYLISVSYYEGSGFLLINRNDGKHFYFWDIPLIFSPDNKRIVITSSSMAGYNPNGIQIFGIKDGKITTELQKKIKNGYPYNARWINKNTIIFDRVYEVLYNRKVSYYVIRQKIKYHNKKWKLADLQ